MLAALLTDFKDALMSGNSGEDRPANLQAGGAWIDTTNEAAPNYYWAFNIYTGSVDIEVFRVNINTGFGGGLTSNSDFQREQISADTAGAVFQLIKQRLAANGQVADGDTVGEIRLVGRTDTSTNPVVASIKWISSDDETAIASGGYLTFYSTADASSSLTEHLRLISGVVETVAAHKLNSLRMVSNNVATTATIAALSATNSLVEMTGSTATNIQGIDATGNAQEITIHNRSSAVVTLKHENSSATATNRLKLPGAGDLTINAQETCVLYYCTTDARWKARGSKKRSVTRSKVSFYGIGRTWTAPAGVTSARVLAYTYRRRLYNNGFLDVYGNAYGWGRNLTAEIGDGTVAAKSSPVLVLGALQFVEVCSPPGEGSVLIGKIGLTATGAAYAWGSNGNAQLGVGDQINRSSPVAVLGGLKFARIITNAIYSIGMDQGGKLYSWGNNARGELGVGDAAIRSSPVAVVGGFLFSKFDSCALAGGSGRGFTTAITSSGVAYSWGSNESGQLGVGDVTSRSSPVAVLGGLTFCKVVGSKPTGNTSCIGLTTAGAAYCWGDNTWGQLGVGDRTPRSSPVAVLGGLTFIDVGLGMGQSIGTAWGLTAAGALYTWGLNTGGILGVGDVVSRSSPVAVLGSIAFAKVLAPGYAWAEDGTLYTWGEAVANNFENPQATSSSPVAVTTLNLADIFFGSVSIAAANDGTIYTWGTDTGSFGGMGDGSVNTTRSSPVAVLGSAGVDGRNAGFMPVTKEITIPVTPGNTYTVFCGDAHSYVGVFPVGGPVDKITIEYES